MKIKSFLLALLFGALVLVIFPLITILLNYRFDLPVFSSPVLDSIGILLIVGGIGIHLSSVYFFKTIGRGTPVPIEPPKKLVRTGFYKFTRNPMYVGLFSIILGGFFILGHVFLLLYSLAFLIFFHFYVIAIEEPKLKERFGQEYIDYMKLVPRWILKI